MISYTLRSAEPRDVPAIVGLVKELAEFENLSHLLELTVEKLQLHLFGAKPVVEALVGEIDGEVVGYPCSSRTSAPFWASRASIWKTSMFARPTAAAAWVRAF